MNRPDAAEPATASPHRITGPVVLGVVPGQPLAALHRAAELAGSLGVRLVCAYVDIATYLVDEGPDGSVASRPIDPDTADDDVEGTSARLKDGIGSALDGYAVSWSFITLAGEPAKALGRLATTVDACMIVVGTRERGVATRLEHLLTGSVAVHLTHRQHRPVLVVPLGPGDGARD
ncbi:universal stress protein [Paenarthrobacter sp. DKR-5]|uniref:universal stress protein n=1 Tax=Paenarthrobacter sp. DKR-5 TaxID=2835535 RepID=UPI001BDCF5DC|nr:universal stress protein [Paenarthrobacter sp. DKR-5]MBT1002958.1 universal stress protein [Paenarthrobacter sp. DKR-5]